MRDDRRYPAGIPQLISRLLELASSPAGYRLVSTMPPKKRTGKHPGSGGPAGASIPGVKALLQSCLKAMAIDVHRLANDDDVGALRKALDVRHTTMCPSCSVGCTPVDRRTMSQHEQRSAASVANLHVHVNVVDQDTVEYTCL